MKIYQGGRLDDGLPLVPEEHRLTLRQAPYQNVHEIFIFFFSILDLSASLFPLLHVLLEPLLEDIVDLFCRLLHRPHVPLDVRALKPWDGVRHNEHSGQVEGALDGPPEPPGVGPHLPEFGLGELLPGYHLQVYVEGEVLKVLVNRDDKAQVIASGPGEEVIREGGDLRCPHMVELLQPLDREELQGGDFPDFAPVGAVGRQRENGIIVSYIPARITIPNQMKYR